MERYKFSHKTKRNGKSCTVEPRSTDTLLNGQPDSIVCPDEKLVYIFSKINPDKL